MKLSYQVGSLQIITPSISTFLEENIPSTTQHHTPCAHHTSEYIVEYCVGEHARSHLAVRDFCQRHLGGDGRVKWGDEWDELRREETVRVSGPA